MVPGARHPWEGFASQSQSQWFRGGAGSHSQWFRGLGIPGKGLHRNRNRNGFEGRGLAIATVSGEGRFTDESRTHRISRARGDSLLVPIACVVDAELRRLCQGRRQELRHGLRRADAGVVGAQLEPRLVEQLAQCPDGLAGQDLQVAPRPIQGFGQGCRGRRRLEADITPEASAPGCHRSRC